jgi:hypothetical protein
MLHGQLRYHPDLVAAVIKPGETEMVAAEKAAPLIFAPRRA